MPDISLKVDNQPLPPVYKRNGRDCYLDPIRKKLIYITPEETVRQKVISFLLRDLNVPAEMIAVEEPLSHYGIRSKKRADIIVHGYVADHNTKEPLAVIECKAPAVYLGEKAGFQMMDYSDQLLSTYSVLTNGVETVCYIYDNNEKIYHRIETLPTYENMIRGVYSAVPDESVPKRIRFDKLMEHKDEFFEWDIGNQTREELLLPCINLNECIYDVSHKLPIRQYTGFRLIEDYGVRLMTYGNAAGGSFWGPYRSFLIEYKGSTEFVSFGMSVYARPENPDISKTALNVAIDNEKTSHHALQIVMDDNAVVSGKKCFIYHHGKIAVGKIGSGKVDELRSFVAESRPEIVDGNRFKLGVLTCDKLWYMDDPEVIVLTENLISYALIRDEYRTYVKQRKM